MKKRNTSLFTLALAVVFLLVFAVSCFAFETAGNFTYQLNADSQSYMLICCKKSASGEVSVPESFNNLPVTGIARGAFSESPNVTLVCVPDSVTVIEEYSLGYEKSGDSFVKIDDFIIRGRLGSAAEDYAEKNDFAFSVNLLTPALTSAKCTVSGVRIDWTSVTDAENYAVYRKTAKSGWKLIGKTVNGETYFNDVAPASGVMYTYTVRAIHGSEKSGYIKAGISVYYLEAPTISSMKNSSDGVVISFKAVNGAKSYRVYKKAYGDSSWSRLTDTDTKTLFATDKTAISGVKYYYTVKALNGNNKSAHYSDKTTLFVAQPVIKSVSNTKTAVTVKWSEVKGAQAYRVYRRVSGGSWTMLSVCDSSKRSYSDSAAKAGEYYKYTVKATIGKTASSYSSGTAVTRLTEPKLTGVKNEAAGVTVTWGKVAGADKYRVFRKTSGGGWTHIATVNSDKLSYTDKKLSSAGTFYYTVRAYKGDCKSSYNNSGLAASFIPAPELVSAKCVKSTVVVKWASVKNAAGYKLYRKIPGGKYSVIATLKGAQKNSYTDRGVKAGNKYIYALKAYTLANAYSAVSNKLTVYVLDPKKPMVALTYDDGPYAPATNKILDVLQKYNAHATFFIVGSRVDEYASCVKRAVKLGCEIGNHTYNHTMLSSASASTIKNELSKTNNKVKSLTGVSPVVMRPPGGAFSSTTKANCSMPMIIWSVDTLDWKTRDSASTIAAVKRNVKDGSIVLMHDLYNSTATAAETIVPWLYKQGYQMVTVSELMDAKGVNMKGGTAYYSAD